MALEMREVCEKCGDTVQQTGEAYICSFECTFCRDCSKEMNSVCPNCSGDLVKRPKRKG